MIQPLIAPTLSTGNRTVDLAWHIAVADLAINLRPWAHSPYEPSEPVIIAGLDYDRPWTRDAALNSSQAGLLIPEIAHRTLLAVLQDDAEWGLRIGGQYWDAIIWVSGAWAHYNQTGNKEFLKTALTATRNSLQYFEAREFDVDKGLFRSGPCFLDGISGYPDHYTDTGGSQGILQWAGNNPHRKHTVGEGLPCWSCSTNCLYANAYRLATCMAQELDETPEPDWASKYIAIKEAINKTFWSNNLGTYRFLADPWGNYDHQEGLASAFAIEAGIASASQITSTFTNHYHAPAGTPCVWPAFSRYAVHGEYGRQAGTVWPHVGARFALLAQAHERHDLFDAEFQKQAAHAFRHGHFNEVLHPDSGEAYGGLQEQRLGGTPVMTHSCRRQTWCATGFIQMVLGGICGFDPQPTGLKIRPHLPLWLRELHLHNIPYRNSSIDIHITRHGSNQNLLCCGEPLQNNVLPADTTGSVILTCNSIINQ